MRAHSVNDDTPARGDAPYGGMPGKGTNNRREPAAPARERELFNNAFSAINFYTMTHYKYIRGYNG
jgi:hypothetical protein